MQKRCTAFEALGSSFPAQLLTLKCCQVAAVTSAHNSAVVDLIGYNFLTSANNMNHQESLATD